MNIYFSMYKHKIISLYHNYFLVPPACNTCKGPLLLCSLCTLPTCTVQGNNRQLYSIHIFLMLCISNWPIGIECSSTIFTRSSAPPFSGWMHVPWPILSGIKFSKILASFKSGTFQEITKKLLKRLLPSCYTFHTGISYIMIA